MTILAQLHHFKTNFRKNAPLKGTKIDQLFCILATKGHLENSNSRKFSFFLGIQ